MLQSQKKTSAGDYNELRMCEGRPMRKDPKRGKRYQAWLCSRKPFDEESGQYCQGRARQFHGKEEEKIRRRVLR